MYILYKNKGLFLYRRKTRKAALQGRLPAILQFSYELKRCIQIAKNVSILTHGGETGVTRRKQSRFARWMRPVFVFKCGKIRHTD